MDLKEVGIDIETYSSVDIDCGVYAYADAPDFEIVLVAYKLPGSDKVKSFMPRRFAERPGVLTPAGLSEEQLSLMPPPEFTLTGDEDEFLWLLTSGKYIFTAFNANFERTCLAKYYGVECNPDEWRCTAVLAATLGLPRSLADVGAAMGLPADKLKLKTGKALIQYFCKPCKPTDTNGGRTRNLPRHDPGKWDLFIEYNLQDVVTEQAILEELRAFRPIPQEQRLWSVDQIICDRGIRIDKPFVEGIVEYDDERAELLKKEAKEISGLENPNSIPQLKKWMASQGETDLANDISKNAVKDALSGDFMKADVRRMLEIRQALGKTSTKKYAAMLSSVCRDGRVRGMLQFYGANRTGRWAGRIVQLQNLPQNHIPDLDLARELVADRDFDGLELLYGEPAHVFSELVRTAFIPSEGSRFVVTDFSAIEARVIAWLAGEQWTLDAFRAGKDIYCETASMMYKVPVEKHGRNAELRQKGKVAVLACGYQGGVGAMKAMDKGGTIPENELQSVVDQWRRANPHIVKLWYDYEAAAKTAISERRPVRRKLGVEFSYINNNLFIKLPGGRKLCYWGARIREDPVSGREQIVYMGVNQTTKQWQEVETYGGKLVENVVQATARDCLAVAMTRVAAMGYRIVMHVHDEMIVDVPVEDTDALARINGAMGAPIDWAPGLPLKGDGYETEFYRKD